MLMELRRVLLRDLATLRSEIGLYPDDASVWKEAPGLPNTGGTLALHLAGNLRHFVGARLGRSGYVRNREAEFTRRGVPRAELLAEIDAASRDVAEILGGLDPATLDAEYPFDFGGTRPSTRQLLLHLSSHLSYHLGQVDYHRRAITRRGETAGAMSIPALEDLGK